MCWNLGKEVCSMQRGCALICISTPCPCSAVHQVCSTRTSHLEHLLCTQIERKPNYCSSVQRRCSRLRVRLIFIKFNSQLLNAGEWDQMYRMGQSKLQPLIAWLTPIAICSSGVAQSSLSPGPSCVNGLEMNR